jgi:hypothetical protein
MQVLTEKTEKEQVRAVNTRTKIGAFPHRGQIQFKDKIQSKFFPKRSGSLQSFVFY